MLNNLPEKTPLVQDFVKVLLAQEILGYCDSADALDAMVDTRDTIQNFKDAAHSHNLTVKNLDGIEYVHGFLKKNEYKNSTVEIFMMEHDGWTVVVIV